MNYFYEPVLFCLQYLYSHDFLTKKNTYGRHFIIINYHPNHKWCMDKFNKLFTYDILLSLCDNVVVAIYQINRFPIQLWIGDDTCNQMLIIIFDMSLKKIKL